MSAISDNQRRLICRSLFLLFCFVPTFVTFYHIFHPQTPEDWAQAIQAELGVETTIGSIETPGPFETIIRDLEFRDGDRTLFHTVEARVLHGNVNRVLIDYSVSQLDSAGLAHLVSRINQHVLRRRGSMSKIWRIEFRDELVIRRSDSQVDPKHDSNSIFGNEFDQLQHDRLVLAGNTRIDLAPTSDGTSLTAYFKVRSTAKPNPGTLKTGEVEVFSETMTFDIKSLPKAQYVQLNTREGHLPIWLIDEVRQDLSESLGRRATFKGSLEIIPEQQRVEYLSGLFEHVDISRYWSIEGKSELATIQIAECKFDGGRFESWDAQLSSPSVIGVKIHQRDLFQPSTQFAFDYAVRQAILASRQYH